jgi:hypothetical protein
VAGPRKGCDFFVAITRCSRSTWRQAAVPVRFSDFVGLMAVTASVSAFCRANGGEWRRRDRHPTYECGTFLVAGLLNLLVVIDAYDVALGHQVMQSHFLLLISPFRLAGAARSRR